MRAICRYSLVCLSVVAAFGRPAWSQLPGFEIVQITDTPGSDSIERHPRMNDCGEIVFTRVVDLQDHLHEIFLYDNGKITQLSNNFVRDAFPAINELGVMTWTQNADGFGGGTVVKYDDGVLTEIATPGNGSDINDAGHIVWRRTWEDGCGSGDRDILLFDGESISMVSEGVQSNQAARINNADEVTWTRYNFCVGPWQSDIMLNSAGDILELTDDHSQPQISYINNLGAVVWVTPDEGDDWVDLWENGTVTRISRGKSPKINDLGQVAFIIPDWDNQRWPIWLYEAGELTPVTDGSILFGIQEMNNYTELVMTNGTTFDIELFLHRRVRNGDGDLDGVVDLVDHQAMVDCFTGPFDTDRLCACRFFDLDHDRDVDLSDFRAFQKEVNP